MSTYDISFTLSDLSRLVPYSITLYIDKTILTTGSGYVMGKDDAGNKMLSEVFNYFDTGDFEYDGDIVEGREYILWQQGSKQLTKGNFQFLTEQNLIIFTGRRVDNDHDSFNLNALIFCREAEQTIRKVYGQAADMNRFAREVTSSNMLEKSLDIYTCYGVTVSNYEGKIKWCNEAFLQMSDRTYVEVTDMRPRDAIYGKRSVYIDSGFVDRMVAKGKPFYFENMGSSALGRQFWFGAAVFPVFDKNGNNIGRIHFIRDISDRKIHDVIAEENESLLQLCIQAARIGLWSLDVTTSALTVNNQFKELLGMGEHTEVGFDRIRALAKENPIAEKIAASYRELRRESPYFRIDYMSLTLNGKTCFFNLNAYCIKFDTSGRPIRIVGTITDVTGEKNKEQTIVRQKEFYESILHELPADVAIFSLDHKYRFVNKYAIKNEAVREWILGKDDFEYCIEKGRPMDTAVMRNGYFNQAMETKSEVRFVESDLKADKHALRILTPIKRADDSIDFVIGYGIDISEQIRSLEKEKQLNEQKNQFIRITSHELRTPLTIIYSNAELLQMVCEEKEAQGDEHTFIDRILKEVNGMIGVLNDLMLMSTIEKNGIELSKERVDVVAYIEELTQPFRPYKDGRILELEAEEEKLLWTFDKRLMKYAITNLLVNAFKYSAGRANPHLRIEAADGQLTIAVTDHGIGIPKDHMGNLFKSFSRADNVGSIHGTGVGLMIVKYTVDKHNGKIEIDSKEGKGTSIKITIPG